MVRMKVFVGNDYKILYTSRGLERPMLIGYVYEYETEEEDVEYWNSLKHEDQEVIVNESQREKTDLRRLIREKRLAS